MFIEFTGLCYAHSSQVTLPRPCDALRCPNNLRSEPVVQEAEGDVEDLSVGQFAAMLGSWQESLFGKPLILTCLWVDLPGRSWELATWWTKPPKVWTHHIFWRLFLSAEQFSASFGHKRRQHLRMFPFVHAVPNDSISATNGLTVSDGTFFSNCAFTNSAIQR